MQADHSRSALLAFRISSGLPFRYCGRSNLRYADRGSVRSQDGLRRQLLGEGTEYSLLDREVLGNGLERECISRLHARLERRGQFRLLFLDSPNTGSRIMTKPSARLTSELRH